MGIRSRVSTICRLRNSGASSSLGNAALNHYRSKRTSSEHNGQRPGRSRAGTKSTNLHLRLDEFVRSRLGVQKLERVLDVAHQDRLREVGIDLLAGAKLWRLV